MCVGKEQAVVPILDAYFMRTYGPPYRNTKDVEKVRRNNALCNVFHHFNETNKKMILYIEFGHHCFELKTNRYSNQSDVSI